MSEARPWLPEPDESNRPYFDAAREGKLRLQQCSDCGGWMFPVRKRCQHCGSRSLQWADASGRGTLYAHGQLQREYHPRHKGHLPVLMAQVDLDEGVRMNTNLVQCEPANAKVGMKVELTFDISPTGEAIPVFKPA